MEGFNFLGRNAAVFHYTTKNMRVAVILLDAHPCASSHAVYIDLAVRIMMLEMLDYPGISIKWVNS